MLLIVLGTVTAAWLFIVALVMATCITAARGDRAIARAVRPASRPHRRLIA